MMLGTGRVGLWLSMNAVVSLRIAVCETKSRYSPAAVVNGNAQGRFLVITQGLPTGSTGTVVLVRVHATGQALCNCASGQDG